MNKEEARIASALGTDEVPEVGEENLLLDALDKCLSKQHVVKEKLGAWGLAIKHLGRFINIVAMSVK
jgi:hypothetical protein